MHYFGKDIGHVWKYSWSSCSA